MSSLLFQYRDSYTAWQKMVVAGDGLLKEKIVLHTIVNMDIEIPLGYTHKL